MSWKFWQALAEATDSRLTDLARWRNPWIHRPAENVAYALRTRVPDMSPNCHQLPTIATISYLRT